jgi:hypothetical protein
MHSIIIILTLTLAIIVVICLVYCIKVLSLLSLLLVTSLPFSLLSLQFFDFVSWRVVYDTGHCTYACGFGV